EVKRNRADGSVGSPHVRVGHRQAPNFLDKRAESQLNKLVFLFLAFSISTFYSSLYHLVC
ncbi:hypothetical protein ACE02B_12635, partial [Shewanella mangrovisoli]|uniref:hypothetical protein n=1 Tax=Shewanella mangrovisoli TaxID=2864211 RepID=UPI0035B9C1BF